MADIKLNGSPFFLSDEVQAKYPELIKLILDTKSINDGGRQHWFDIMPSMTDEQVDEVFNILNKESNMLEELEFKFQVAIKAVKDKYLVKCQMCKITDLKTGTQFQKINNKYFEGDIDEVLTILDEIQWHIDTKL